jgi:hypothetical protein
LKSQMEQQRDAAEAVAQTTNAARLERRQLAAEVLAKRPKLTADDVVNYLDWVTTGMHVMTQQEVGHHLTAAELAIRTRMGDAQGKATAHSEAT